MNRNIHKFILSVILVAGVHYKVFGDEITEEELFFMKIPHIVTASRKEQLITEAPATVTVVSEEEIRNSGATSIPEVLRMVAGVDVMGISVRNPQVSIRGFNKPMSNKLLVMIDGRSVNWDTYGVVLWDVLPVGLKEIKQIEIIRGPGSSLYGANAYCGVINIITKSPEEIDNLEVSVAGGNYNTLIVSLLHSGAVQKIKYKISTEWDNTNEWRDKKEKAGRLARGNFLLDYNIGEKNKISLSGGRGWNKNQRWFSAEPVGTVGLSGNYDYVQLDYGYSDIKFRTFFKKDDLDAEYLRMGVKQHWLTTTWDTEIQQTLKLNEGYSLIWGANYRYNTVKKNSFISNNKSQELNALFLENELKMFDDFNIALGARYDSHPLVGEHFSPRCSITYFPAVEHEIRWSVNKAFRNPSFVDSYLYTEEQKILSLPAPLPSMDVPYTHVIQGSEDLKSEGIISYEIEYRTKWAGNIKSRLNVFYNKYTRLFTDNLRVTYYDADEVYIGSPPGAIPKKIISSFENGGEASGTGGELELDFLLTDFLSGFVNYSYQEIIDEADNLITKLINERDRIRTKYPRNKINGGIRLSLKNGISGSLLVSWVDKTSRHLYDIQGNEYLSEVSDYAVVNIRVGYILMDERADLSLAVLNLFNNKHYEYPPGINLPDASSDEIGRRITVQAKYRF